VFGVGLEKLRFGEINKKVGRTNCRMRLPVGRQGFRIVELKTFGKKYIRTKQQRARGIERIAWLEEQ